MVASQLSRLTGALTYIPNSNGSFENMIMIFNLCRLRGSYISIWWQSPADANKISPIKFVKYTNKFDIGYHLHSTSSSSCSAATHRKRIVQTVWIKPNGDALNASKWILKYFCISCGVAFGESRDCYESIIDIVEQLESNRHNIQMMQRETHTFMSPCAKTHQILLRASSFSRHFRSLLFAIEHHNTYTEPASSSVNGDTNEEEKEKRVNQIVDIWFWFFAKCNANNV